MSVRAYKIIKVQYAEDPTFNLWHDHKFMALLENANVNERLDDGGGEIEINAEQLKEMTKDFKKESKKDWSNEEREEVKDILARIKEDMKDDGHVTYSCF